VIRPIFRLKPEATLSRPDALRVHIERQRPARSGAEARGEKVE
jgi:hypothetical protein